jgi:hypothetical protein
MRKLVCFWLCLALVVPVWAQSGETAIAAPDSAGQRALPVMVIDQWQDMSSTNMQIEIMHPEEKPGFELWIIAVMLTLYGVFSLYYKGYLSENIRVVFNYRLATQIERERELANSLPGLVLMLLFRRLVALESIPTGITVSFLRPPIAFPARFFSRAANPVRTKAGLAFLVQQSVSVWHRYRTIYFSKQRIIPDRRVCALPLSFPVLPER